LSPPRSKPRFWQRAQRFGQLALYLTSSRSRSKMRKLFLTHRSTPGETFSRAALLMLPGAISLRHRTCCFLLFNFRLLSFKKTPPFHNASSQVRAIPLSPFPRTVSLYLFASSSEDFKFSRRYFGQLLPSRVFSFVFRILRFHLIPL